MRGQEEAWSSSRRQYRRKKKAKADIAYRSHGLSSRPLWRPWAKISISSIPCLRSTQACLIIPGIFNHWLGESLGRIVLAPRVPGHTSWDRLAQACPAVGNLRAALLLPAHYFFYQKQLETPVLKHLCGLVNFSSDSHQSKHIGGFSHLVS